ncbi:MAG: GAF domain-containing protein [Cyanobacteria bacterium P01_G01_bin.4]
MTTLLDSTRLLFELQRSHHITRSLAGLTSPEEIAKRVTDGAIDQFGCAFARIWLVESDRTALRLVASSGLYTHINGSFARVPMGAYKVGKIAQNCVSFLSNNLPEEPWVKDRDWAIANQIQGFAGYPLVVDGQAIGVLAIFSRQPLAAEFLEVLQGLCSTVTVALQTALQYRKDRQGLVSGVNNTQALSDRLARILDTTRLTMVGTESPLGPSQTYLFLQVGEVLNQLDCSYCRLTYGRGDVSLEAIVGLDTDGGSQVEEAFGSVLVALHSLGGTLQLQRSREQAAMQVSFQVPVYAPTTACDVSLYIVCRQHLLQLAFTQLAYVTGLVVATHRESGGLVLTDNTNEINRGDRVLWVRQRIDPPPTEAVACLNLSLTPTQFREVIETVMRGETWGIERNSTEPSLDISSREQEIAGLLAMGMRDRDIAQELHISESTVKFHMNKVMAKLKSRTRYQALYQLTSKGWL